MLSPYAIFRVTFCVLKSILISLIEHIVNDNNRPVGESTD